MRGAAAVLLVAALLAGCFQQSPDPDLHAEARDEVRAAVRPVLVRDHDAERGHFDASLHQAAVNMELVGYSNGVDDSGDPDRIPAKGAFNEIALHGNLAFLSRTSSDGSFGGFSIVDIADPSAPKVVGQYRAQGGADVEVTDDGQFAFVATQRNTHDQMVGSVQSTQDPGSAAPRGIDVVRVSDPAKPVRDSFVPLPVNGPHTVTYVNHPVTQDEYLVVCTYDLVTDPVTRAILSSNPATQRLLVYLIVRNPAAGAVPVPAIGLVQVAQYQLAPEEPGQMAFPHDATVMYDAASGKAVLAVAYWDLGVRLLDFTQPPSPGAPSPPTLPELGSATDFSPSAYNAIHLAKAFPETLEDATGAQLQVTVAEPEIITSPEETGQLTFLDTTDPAAPRRLSHWTLPPQDPPIGVTGLDFSPHNFDTFDGKVAVAHYHAGLWIVDVSTPENLAEPKEVGFYMTAKPRKDSPVLQPDAWSVRARDGLLYVTDEASGLYILRYTGP